VNSHHRAEVALRVLVWIEVTRESRPRDVQNWSNIFHICWVLTFTTYPDCVQLKQYNIPAIIIASKPLTSASSTASTDM
jgi:hypothetical protein